MEKSRGKKIYKLFAPNSNISIDKTLIQFVRHLDSGPCHERSLQGHQNQVKECRYTACCKVPSLPNDFGRGDMLISFRTMANVQANIFVSAPYQTPKDGLFQRATSFQDSFEELKTHYATDDSIRHPDYRAELQTLLSTYFEELLGIAGASEVKAPRPRAPASTPKKPLRRRIPRRRPPRRRPLRRRTPLRQLPRRRRPWQRRCDPAGGGQRSPRAHRWRINLFVLDERCAVVCRNRTAIQLPAEFHLRFILQNRKKL